MILFGLSLGKRGLNWLLANVCFILFFAIVYFLADMMTHNFEFITNTFGEASEKDFIDYIYFSLTIQTTVGLDVDGFGYSNIVNPKFKTNRLTRIINIFQLLSVLVVVATSV